MTAFFVALCGRLAGWPGRASSGASSDAVLMRAVNPRFRGRFGNERVFTEEGNAGAGGRWNRWGVWWSGQDGRGGGDVIPALISPLPRQLVTRYGEAPRWARSPTNI